MKTVRTFARSHVRTLRQQHKTSNQITTHFEGTFIKLSGNVRNFEVKHYDIYNDIALRTRTTRDESTIKRSIEEALYLVDYTPNLWYILYLSFLVLCRRTCSNAIHLLYIAARHTYPSGALSSLIITKKKSSFKDYP